MFFNDAVHDSLEYSFYVLAGYPLYLLLGAVLTSLLGRISVFQAKKTAVLCRFTPLMFSSISAIIFADRIYGTPVLSIDGAGRWLIMGLSFICIVLVSFWAKVKVLVCSFGRRSVIFQVLGWDSEARGIAEAYIPYIGLIVLMAFEAKRSKKTAENE
ncbi:HAAS domain-containing protein [Bacillus swezeyi]|uniref:HAAS domain-containing protein n=2 Tax=Bacillus swezeyi TaxID=1925020 RepID=UPI0037BEB088